MIAFSSHHQRHFCTYSSLISTINHKTGSLSLIKLKQPYSALHRHSIVLLHSFRCIAQTHTHTHTWHAPCGIVLPEWRSDPLFNHLFIWMHHLMEHHHRFLKIPSVPNCISLDGKTRRDVAKAPHIENTYIRIYTHIHIHTWSASRSV